jgi:hypothetical protein
VSGAAAAGSATSGGVTSRARWRGERLALTALTLVGARLGLDAFAVWLIADDRVGTVEEGTLTSGRLVAAMLQTLLYVAVAVVIVRRSRTGIAIAATYVGYGLAMLVARGAIGPFGMAALAIGTALLVALLALRATDVVALDLRARGALLAVAGGALAGGLIGIALVGG